MGPLGTPARPADTGEVFTTPISTALRFVNFRLPFTSFRYNTGGQGPSKLDPSRLVRLSVRYAPLQDPEVLVLSQIQNNTYACTMTLAWLHSYSLCLRRDGHAGMITRRPGCPLW